MSHNNLIMYFNWATSIVRTICTAAIVQQFSHTRTKKKQNYLFKKKNNFILYDLCVRSNFKQFLFVDDGIRNTSNTELNFVSARSNIHNGFVRSKIYVHRSNTVCLLVGLIRFCFCLWTLNNTCTHHTVSYDSCVQLVSYTVHRANDVRTRDEII